MVRVERSIRQLTNDAARAIADFILPPKCQLCQDDVERQGGLCACCWGKLEFLERPRCPRTGMPFPYDPGSEVESAAALVSPPTWNRAVAAVAFDDVSRDLVHALKYRDRHEAACVMTTLMLRAGRELVEDAHMLIPVPLHRGRLWSRRYNQSAILASRLAKLCGLPFASNLLIRTKATRPQVGLSQSERRRNLRNAFAVSSSGELELSGRRIILVDDVLTTGSTAEACTNALYKSGVEQVDVLVFALVIRPEQLTAE